VQTSRNGKKVIAGIRLRHEPAGWRIDSFE
jgi:hypothetical protein